MKNITVAIDDEIYRQARVAAARQGTSVSAIVGNYLRALVNGAVPLPEDGSKVDQEQKERAELVELFRQAHLVLGYNPSRQKTYER